MTISPQDNSIRIYIEWFHEFEKEVINKVKDLENNEFELIRAARKVPLLNREQSNSWRDWKLMTILDEKDNVRSRIKVSNWINIAPEVTNPVVENMVVVSVWMKWENLWSLLRAIGNKI
jgi:hypothetical protein